MNSTKKFTRIILTAIGIFYIIKIIPAIIQTTAFAIYSRTRESLWSVSIGILLTAIAILLLWYFFFYLRDWLAEKIIGRNTTDESDRQVAWFPAALRLSCVFAGLYCFFTAVLMLLQQLSIYFLYAGQNLSRTPVVFDIIKIIELILLFAGSVYLVLGAPHFVRWQVWKTTEQCRKFESSESASGS